MILAKNTVYTILFALLALVILWFAYKNGYFFATRETFEADPETGYDKKMHVLTMFSTHLARKPTEDEYKRYLSIPAASDEKLLEKFKKEYAAEIAKPPALSKEEEADVDEEETPAPKKTVKKTEQKIESMEQPTSPPPASTTAGAASPAAAAAGMANVAPKIDTTPALTPAQLQQLQAEKSIESFQASAVPEPFQPGYSGLSFGSIPDDKVCVNRFTVSSMLNKMSEELRQLKEIMSMQ